MCAFHYITVDAGDGMAWQLVRSRQPALATSRTAQQGLLSAAAPHLHIRAELAVLPAGGVICDALQAWRHQLLWRDSLWCLRGRLCHGCAQSSAGCGSVRCKQPVSVDFTATGHVVHLEDAARVGLHQNTSHATHSVMLF